MTSKHSKINESIGKWRATCALSFQSFKVHSVFHEQRNIFGSRNRIHSYGGVTQNCSFPIYNSRSSGETMRSSVALPFPSDETEHTVGVRSFPTFQSQWLYSYSRFNSKNKPLAVHRSHRWCLQVWFGTGGSFSAMHCPLTCLVASNGIFSPTLSNFAHVTASDWMWPIPARELGRTQGAENKLLRFRNGELMATIYFYCPMSLEFAPCSVKSNFIVFVHLLPWEFALFLEFDVFFICRNYYCHRFTVFSDDNKSKWQENCRFKHSHIDDDDFSYSIKGNKPAITITLQLEINLVAQFREHGTVA